MRKLLVGATRWFVLVGLTTLLVACGSSGDGPRQLTEDDYLLDVSGSMAAGEYDGGTRIWVLEASGFNSDGQVDTNYVQPFYAVGAGGAIDFQLDARDLNQDTAPLDPRQFLNWYAGSDVTELQVNISDPVARWKSVMQLYAFQPSPGEPPRSVASHTLGAWYRDGNSLRPTTPVFSDRAVTVTGSWTRQAFSYQLDATLQPGWNFLHYVGGTTSNSFVLTTFPASGSEEFLPSRRTLLLTGARIPEAYGVAVLAEHELSAATPTVLGTSRFPNGNAPVAVVTWQGFADSNPALVPFDEIYPGVLSSSNVSSMPADARGILASPYAYDSAGILVDDWWQSPTDAMGRVHITSSAGNTVLSVYSDRDATLTLTGPVDDGSGNSLTTDPGGLELQFGWNRIELVPDGGNILKLTRVTAIPPNADPILTIN